MAGPRKNGFGKRGAAAATDEAPRKRSDTARLTLMAGAGAAALGVYGLSPSRSCEGSIYMSQEQCIAGRTFTDAQCRIAFGPNKTAGGVLMRGNSDTGPIAVPLTGADGRWRGPDGSAIEESRLCRRGSSSSSSSSGSRRSFFGGSGWSDSSSSHSGSYGSSSSSSNSSGGVTSKGGFGSTGASYSGGGG